MSGQHPDVIRRAVGGLQAGPIASGRAAFALIVIAAAVLQGSCGYTLAGRGSFLPAHIQTIGVPMFANSTTFFEVEQVLTERVRSELIGRGRYRVLSESTGVDAVLNGEITSIALSPVSFTEQQQAARYVFVLHARIVFQDLLTNDVIWENPSLVFQEEYEIGGQALDPTAFFGQESNAVSRIANDFARTVVSAILEAF